MRMFSWVRSKWGVGLFAILLAAGTGVWLARDAILACYYVHGLTWANDADRPAWVECLVRVEDGAVPRLVDCLSGADAHICANAQAGLMGTAQRWPAYDPRRAALAHRLTEQFPRLSLAGQSAVLALLTDWLKPEPPPEAEVLACAERLLPLADRSPDREVRRTGLTLAEAIFCRDRRTEVVAACREAIRKGFQDCEADNRALAARLAARPEMNLLPQVVTLLDDPAASVRQAAMLAVGPAPEAITTDDLLRSLHDSDEDVRLLCEAALRRRGLAKEDVSLGRLISDTQPGVRLQVLDRLRHAADREPGVWLRRLSHDPVPAVRAAAIRAAGDHRQVDLTDRLRQMAQSDPSPTVRQLASYYLGRRQARE